MLQDPDLRIFRPRQVYTGKHNLQYLPHEQRNVNDPHGEIAGYVVGKINE